MSLLFFNQRASPLSSVARMTSSSALSLGKQIIEDAAAGRGHMTRAVFITQHIFGFHDLTCIELIRIMAPSKAFSVPAKTNRNFSSG